jgi:hypothetical protein
MNANYHRRLLPMGPKTFGEGWSGTGGDELSVVAKRGLLFILGTIYRGS